MLNDLLEVDYLDTCDSGMHCEIQVTVLVDKLREEYKDAIGSLSLHCMVDGVSVAEPEQLYDDINVDHRYVFSVYLEAENDDAESEILLRLQYDLQIVTQQRIKILVEL